MTLAAAIVHGALGYWGGSIWLWLALPAWAGAGVGYLLPLLVRPLHRALVGAEVLDSRVDRRAAAAFAESEVFATRARTGLLLLVALFEHRVEIVCDRGVEARVPSAEWAPDRRSPDRAACARAAPRSRSWPPSARSAACSSRAV